MLHLNGKSILGIVIVSAIVVFAKSSQQSDLSKNLLGQMRAAIHDLDSYSTDAEFFDTALEQEHETAFHAHCFLGTRNGAAACDQKKYVTDVLAGMRKACERAKMNGAVTELKALEQVLLEDSAS